MHDSIDGFVPDMNTRPRSLCWVPVWMLIHNLEEAATMRGFLASGQFTLPGAIGRVIPIPSYPQFLLPLALAAVLPFLFLLMLRFERTRRLGSILLLLVQTVMFLNVFSHAVTALLIGAYTPGLLTALVINLPFSIHLAIQCRPHTGKPAQSILALFAAAIVIHGPALLGLMWLSYRLVPS